MAGTVIIVIVHKDNMYALDYNGVAQRPDLESALRVLKRRCRPFLWYTYGRQCDIIDKNTRNTHKIKIAAFTMYM